MSTTESIAEHNRRWSDLPLFTQHHWVASDEDIAAWSDILHMRTLVNQIEDALRDNESAHDILGGGEREGRGLVEFDIDLYLEPWPDIDRAADMLAAWKACGHGVPARLEIL